MAEKKTQKQYTCYPEILLLHLFNEIKYKVELWLIFLLFFLLTILIFKLLRCSGLDS